MITTQKNLQSVPEELMIISQSNSDLVHFPAILYALRAIYFPVFRLPSSVSGLPPIY
jgi:hypothetical protein